MELVDNYCSNYLFGSLTNYDINENYAVLTIMEVYSFIKQEFRKALNEFLLSFNTESKLMLLGEKLSVMKYWRMKKDHLKG